MDRHLARLFAHRRLVLFLSGLIGVYGFIMSFLIATSIGFNNYTPEELDSIEKLQQVLRNVVGVGAILGAVAAVLAAFHIPLAIATFITAGIVGAIGLGLVGAGWGVVSGPRVEYYLAPVPVFHWVTAGLLAWSLVSKGPRTHTEVTT